MNWSNYHELLTSHLTWLNKVARYDSLLYVMLTSVEELVLITIRKINIGSGIWPHRISVYNINRVLLLESSIGGEAQHLTLTWHLGELDT